MKKFMLLMMVLLVGLLAACGDDAAEEEETDTATGATQTVVTDEDVLLDGVTSNGGWILIFEGDMETDEELVLEEGTHRDEEARKLALYTQDDDRNILDQFTLTAPQITVQSDNTRIQGGTFVGDVYVEANNFSIPDATITGNIYFADEEYEGSADLTGGTVTGDVEVQ